MSLTMYQASIPVFVRGLSALRGLLRKGAAHAAASETDPNALVAAQLAPDMLTLAGGTAGQRHLEALGAAAERGCGAVDA